MRRNDVNPVHPCEARDPLDLVRCPYCREELTYARWTGGECCVDEPDPPTVRERIERAWGAQP